MNIISSSIPLLSTFTSFFEKDVIQHKDVQIDSDFGSDSDSVCCNPLEIGEAYGNLASVLEDGECVQLDGKAMTITDLYEKAVEKV